MTRSKINTEIILGAIFGVITIIAVICEMSFNGFTAVAIADGIKEISSTIVSVWIFILAWAAMHHRKEKTFDFEKELAYRLRMWEEKNSNLIFIKDEERPFDIYMKTNVENYFEGGHQEYPGRFVLISLGDNIKLSFSLNRSLLVGHSVDNAKYKETANRVTRQITSYVDRIYGKEATIKSTSSYNIEFVMKNSERNRQELDKIMAIINTMYQAFLVVASTNR